MKKLHPPRQGVIVVSRNHAIFGANLILDINILPMSIIRLIEIQTNDCLRVHTSLRLLRKTLVD